MIVLCVSSYNGAPTEPREASFDELGGTIGRATTNQLVLPDPDRTISRVHAQVVLRNGGFIVVDRGSNAISINGTPLGNGRESPLKPGDTLDIGGYVIQVRKGHQTVAVDPFGDLFGTPATRRPPPPAAASFAPPPPPAPSPMPAPMAAIPADWDPFAPDVHTSAPGLGLPATGPSDPLGLGGLVQPPQPSGPSLDDLFGLGPLGSAPADPLGVLGAPPAAANTASDSDPLRALMQPARALPPATADAVSDLHLPWQAPPAPTPPKAPPQHAPTGAVLSWDASMRDNKVITLPDVRHLEELQEPRAAANPVAAASLPSSAPAGDTSALLEALMKGLGLTAPPVQTLTPATMQLVGELLREATRGAVELLRARAALKQEVRAQVTMIVTQGNNPLKFSPTVDVALNHLLGPTSAGFMPPARAMRDAFDDLRAHEIGMMAGMRAALDGVLSRFDPQTLDSAITKRGALASLLPGSRKAQLWEQFQLLYTQLSREAADDFHTLFGKAFLKAYEAQLLALDEEPGPGTAPRH